MCDSSSKRTQERTFWVLLLCEAGSVSVWSILAPLLRWSVTCCAKLAAYRTLSFTSTLTSTVTSPWHELHVTLSVLASGLLSLFPSKVASFAAPGFTFASGWLLFLVSGIFGPMPNVPIRICEMGMGRLTLRELGIILPIHFLCTLSTIKTLRWILLSSEEEHPQGPLTHIAIEPILYSSHNPLTVDFLREVAANASFCVAMLVLPELLKLNRIPTWFTTVLMYPIYSYAVDADGKGSIFGPNISYAMSALAGGDECESASQLIHLTGPVLGGLVAGKIMSTYFPDDDPIRK